MQQPPPDYTNRLEPGIRPQDDFFGYINNRWIAEHPIPDDERGTDTFLMLAKKIWAEMHALYETLAASDAAKGSIEQQVRDFYYTGTHFDELEATHLAKLSAWFAKIDAADDISSLCGLLGELERIGVPALFAGFVAPDNQNASRHLFYVTQPELTLPDRDYYLSGDMRMKAIRRAYERHVKQVRAYFPELAPDANTLWHTVWAIEYGMAKHSRERSELRDPERNYNRMSFALVRRDYAGIDWVAYATGLGWRPGRSLSVDQPEYIAYVCEQISSRPIDEWRIYLKWKLLVRYCPRISERFAALSFEFFGKLLGGRRSMLPLWERVARMIDVQFGEGAGQLYIAKYFPESHKEEVRSLVEEVRDAFAERITSLDWMSEATKTKTLEKLQAITVLVGYPDEWRDYSSLAIGRTSYIANLMALQGHTADYFLGKLTRPVTKDEWLMCPQMVNAYNDPARLVICFPAAILQPPFFDVHAPAAANMGGIGTVIAHELTHGFDDRGCRFDARGNVRKWQTATERRAFAARARLLIDHANQFEVLPGVYMNGGMVIGESIADLGGIEISYQALWNQLGCDPNKVQYGAFTAAQLFFMQYAVTECSHVRAERLREAVLTDYHPDSRFRVNGILAHSTAFYESFDIRPGDKLYRPPDSRAAIW